jgi:hypothetical protein
MRGANIIANVGFEWEEDHLALLRNLTIVLALGIIANLGVLALSGQLAAVRKPFGTKVTIPDPPPLPCSRQSWPNGDRICLSWTALSNETPAVTSAIRRKQREAGSNFVSASADATPGSSDGATTGVNRDRKSDRLPVLGGINPASPAKLVKTTVVRKNAMPAKALVDCEPVAAPYADPVLGRIINRCFV